MKKVIMFTTLLSSFNLEALPPQYASEAFSERKSALQTSGSPTASSTSSDEENSDMSDSDESDNSPEANGIQTLSRSIHRATEIYDYLLLRTYLERERQRREEQNAEESEFCNVL